LHLETGVSIDVNKSKNISTVRTDPNSNQKVVDTGTIDTSTIRTRDCALYWLGAIT